jgi:hypothetical protein
MTEIQFKSFLPELTKDFPIIKACEYRYDWYKFAVRDLKEDPNASHTAKCPGIIAINATGWIQRTYQNFTIDIVNDREFKWYTEIDQNNAFSNTIKFADYIDYHAPEQYYKYNPGAFENTCHTILKVNSPWYVVIPEGYSLLCMPVPYNDENRLVSATGILTGKQWLNMQLYVKAISGRIEIKAGTPLQQYILIKNEDVKTGIYNFDPDDIKVLFHPPYGDRNA